MASKRQRRWKQCGRKVRHKSEQIARRVVTVLRKRDGEMHHYRCGFCGGWHVGH